MRKNEIIVRFCIWDFDDISHETITEHIGVSPIRIYVKGERMNEKLPQVAKRNGWLYESPLGKYACFEDQMNSILDILESKTEILNPLCERYYCEFSCALFIYNNEESTPWVHLNSRYNSLIKRLNIEFDFDIYCHQELIE
ncbi:MAG TPA: DUF4279 domain-containing protein [Ohtaekwangia sp.]|uniref:DUF4279 domain-containing protein n=1 Tax=Ohtaekwangia sp. TaxID=2066019 RepID=UPI002F9241D9